MFLPHLAHFLAQAASVANSSTMATRPATCVHVKHLGTNHSWNVYELPSGELTFCYGKIHHFVAGKIHYFDWAIFNNYVKLPEGMDFYHS